MIQVLGLCRWSYPSAPGAFKNKGQTLEALRAELYTEARLQTRLFFLERLIVPCLKAQTDQDFTLLLMLGDQLPEPWRGRVLEAVSDTPQIKPLFLPEGQNHMELCTEVARAHRDPSARAVAEFRLDDDDAVAQEFTEELRANFTRLKPFYREAGKCALDYARGILLRCHPNGDMGFETVEARLWTPGLALYYPPDHKRSLLNYPHMRTWKNMPVMSLQQKPMFIRSAHAGNDSELLDRNVSNYRFPLDKIPALLQDRFGINAEALEADWKALLTS